MFMIHEGTSKNENLFEKLTENVSVCIIYKTFSEVNKGPMGRTLTKTNRDAPGRPLEQQAAMDTTIPCRSPNLPI